MRLAFLCSGLEPGADGVGDYARQLAQALTARGHPSVCAALGVAAAPPSAISADGTEARWRDVFQNQEEARALAGWLRNFSPDWVSVQYTPFGFHPRGLGAARARRLREWLPPGAKRHVMFHELWLQPRAGEPWRWRVLGWLQHRVVKAWGAKLFTPHAVHTQARLHQLLLSRVQVTAALLPLFSGVPVRADAPAHPRAWLVKKLRERGYAPPLAEDSTVWWIGHFGTLHPGPDWNPVLVAQELAQIAARQGRRAGFVALGRLGVGEAAWRAIETSLSPPAFAGNLGSLSASDASWALAACDTALAATPSHLIEKSGVVASWRAHNVPVMVPRPALPQLGALPPWPDPGILPWPLPGGQIPARRIPAPAFCSVEYAADTLLADLAKSSSTPA